MTKKQDFDSSKILALLDQEELKKAGFKLATEALSDSITEYEEFDIKFRVPSNIVQLLTPLTEMFPIELEDLLSNMANQGFTTVIKEAIKEPFEQDNTNPLDGIESVNQIADQVSEIKEVMEQFSQMKDLFQGIPDLNNLMNSVHKSNK